jgi:hypothetical protein
LGAFDLDHVTGAEIMHRDDPAQLRLVFQYGGEANQIGMVELVVCGRRQGRARRVEPEPAQRLGLVAINDAGKLGDHHPVALGDADDAQRETPRPTFVFKRAVIGDRLGAIGETLDPDRSAHPVRRADHAHADTLLCTGHNNIVSPANAGI